MWRDAQVPIGAHNYGSRILVLLLSFGIAAIPARTAHAACQMYVEPDACTMLWTLETDFWVGVYSVEAGPGTVTGNGMTIPMPPEPLGQATVFQLGPDIVIDHPDRMLQAQLTAVDPGLPEWTWADDLAEGMPGATLGDVELMLGCSNAEMLRWTAQTYSEDGYPMTLDLVAVGPYNIYGHLHMDGVVEGTRIRWERQVIFTRSEFPTEGLGTQTVNDDAYCEARCAEQPFICPGLTNN